MKNRIPTADDVGKLSRDEWEELCACLFAISEGVHRVEDHHGKGNGLDGWKESDGGICGYQYRRLDGRLGKSQVEHLEQLTTHSQRALCLWHLDQLEDASNTLEKVVEQAADRLES